MLSLSKCCKNSKIPLNIKQIVSRSPHNIPKNAPNNRFYGQLIKRQSSLNNFKVNNSLRGFLLTGQFNSISNKGKKIFGNLITRRGIVLVGVLLESLIERNRSLNTSGREAFKAYVRAYDSNHLKIIFDVSTLNLAKVALSFGFKVPPAVDLNVSKRKGKHREKRGNRGTRQFSR